MTRRPVQQARRITDRRQFLGDWPEREPIEWPPIRMTLGETLRFVGLVLGLLIVFAAAVTPMIMAVAK